MKTGTLFAGCMLAAGLAFGVAAGPSPESIKTSITKVANWQITTFADHMDFRAVPQNRKDFREDKPYHDLTWHMGALYAGMNEWRKASGDSFADKTEVYGVGAFLAAGTEVYKLAGGELIPAESIGCQPAQAPTNEAK
ncbi:MAG: hypothetical protein MUC65_06480 [Pontiellaceae bacterium]|nr:hypothetical protein [Pontiellaceae bacterium]